MARWLVPLSVVLLLVLAAHGIVLWGVAQQVQAMTSAITQPADPLFTRQITQQGSSDAPPSPVAPSKNTENKVLSAVNPAQPAIKNIATNSTKTAVVQTATIDTAPEATRTASVNTPTQASGTDSFTTTASASTSSAAATDTTVLSSTASVALTTGTATSADAAASLAQLGAWPTDTRLTYELGGYFRGELHGDAQVQWTRFAAVDAGSPGTTTTATAVADANNPRNRYQMRINLGIGPISSQLISQGRIRATGLVPEAYEEQLSGTRRRTLTMDAQSAILQDGRRLPRPDGPQELVQDTASQFVDLGQRFTSGRARLVAGETVRVWLARPGGLDEWTYVVGPAETIDLPKIGPVIAYGLTPRPIANPRGTITAQMWFAPSLQNLPVRIKVTLNNETHVDLRVKKIEQR